MSPAPNHSLPARAPQIQSDEEIAPEGAGGMAEDAESRLRRVAGILARAAIRVARRRRTGGEAEPSK